MKQLYKVRVASGLDYESISDIELNLKIGDKVIVRCERYLDFATVIEPLGEPIANFEEFERQRAAQNKGRHIEGHHISQIIRVATSEDCETAAANARDSFSAHNMTMERIKAHHLEMKLIHTHYAFDRNLIIFQFSADGRIDFRELLRDLSGLFKIRVELRQVGVRDEASILGGLGTCGRPFCCAAFLPSFNSINVKMAKQQGLSLNPQNISGCCGRLKCCLQYEADVYNELGLDLGIKRSTPTSNAAENANDDSDGEVPDMPSETAESPVQTDEDTVTQPPREQHEQRPNRNRENRDGKPPREQREQRDNHDGNRNANGGNNGNDQQRRQKGGEQRPQRQPNGQQREQRDNREQRPNHEQRPNGNHGNGNNPNDGRRDNRDNRRQRDQNGNNRPLKPQKRPLPPENPAEASPAPVSPSAPSESDRQQPPANKWEP